MSVTSDSATARRKLTNSTGPGICDPDFEGAFHFKTPPFSTSETAVVKTTHLIFPRDWFLCLWRGRGSDAAPSRQLPSRYYRLQTSCNQTDAIQSISVLQAILPDYASRRSSSRQSQLSLITVTSMGDSQRTGVSYQVIPTWVGRYLDTSTECLMTKRRTRN